jgi:hypothetical protein
MNTELLARIYGEVSALHMLPLLHPRQLSWGGWMAAYRENGLGFADSRKQAEELRKLVAAGLLTANGSTQSRGFRLTFRGALTASAWSGIFIQDCQRAANDLKRAVDKTRDSLPSADWKIVLGFELIREAGENWKKVGSDPQKYTLAMSKCITRLMPLLACGFAELLPSYSGTAFALHLHTMPDAKMWQVDGAPVNDLQAGEHWKAHCKGFDSGIARFTREPPAAFSGVVPCMIPATRHRS